MATVDTKELTRDQQLEALKTEGKNLARRIEEHSRFGMGMVLEVAALSHQFGRHHEFWPEMVTDESVRKVWDEMDINTTHLKWEDRQHVVEPALSRMLTEELQEHRFLEFSRDSVKRIATITGMMGYASLGQGEALILVHKPFNDRAAQVLGLK